VTKAQQVYEKVEALVASGTRKADAFRQVADELGQPFDSIRGAYYTHTRSLGGTPGRSRKREQTPADPIEAATSVLTRALEVIADQVEAAKTRADEAQAEYEQLRDSAGQRKATIQAKIDALNAEITDAADHLVNEGGPA
jgi:acyl-CoA reductase-like NAD-dependent aldehyde dehydrogenase